MRRAWIWTKRFAGDLNGTSGAAGLGGLLMSGASLTTQGLASLSLLTVGTLIASGAVISSAIRSYPRDLLATKWMLGKEVAIENIENLDPRPLRIGVIGLSGAGKSTLKSSICSLPRLKAVTTVLHATVSSLRNSPSTYIAMLDGAGDNVGHQFDIAEQSDIVVVLVDHNSSDSSAELDQERLRNHFEFLKQLRFRLKAKRQERPLKELLLLVNKRDLLPESGEASAVAVRFRAELQAWTDVGYASKVSCRPHSNNSVDDLIAIEAIFKAHVVA